MAKEFLECMKCNDSGKKGFIPLYKVVMFKTGPMKLPNGFRQCSTCKGKGFVPKESTETPSLNG